MALKNHEIVVQEDISFFMNETATRGCVVVINTATTGVGSALDDANAVVKLPDNLNGSGEGPVGILMVDVVNKDLTETHTNHHKREVNVGGKVNILVRGECQTDVIEPHVTPVPGQLAYFNNSGVLNAANYGSVPAVSQVVGRWMSGKDSDGYAKLRVGPV